MKLSHLSLGFLIATGVAIGQQHQNRANDSVSIQQLEQADADAARVNDVDTLASLWTDDGVLLQPMSPPAIGRDSIRALLMKQKEGSSSIQTVSYIEDWKERQIVGNNAFEWGTITVGLRLADGRQVTQSVFAGRYLVRNDRTGWRFARVVITPAPKPQ